MIKPIILACAALSLAGCTTLPRSGPTDQRIVSSAAATLTQPDRGTAVQYALVDLNPQVIAHIPDYTVGSLNKSFGLRGSSAANLMIGVGDKVQVTIYEGKDGGLFIPAGGGGSTGNFVTLPAQTVSREGTITVPFAGRKVDEGQAIPQGDIHAAGMSVPALQETIRAALSTRAIQPQVVVSLTRSASSEVTVLGDVAASQKIMLGDAGERVLDVIARAGGIKEKPFETFVSVTRNGRKGTIYFNELANNTNENIYLSPGDLVFIEADKRRFTAFGSTGLTGEFDFGSESIALDSAVAKAGGLLDGRADPSQVFVYRQEARSVLESVGVDLGNFPPTQTIIPTVYRANFADPGSFFLARSFPMRNGDVIYISNAASVEVNKFVNFVSGIAGGNNTVINSIQNTRDLIR